MQRVKGRVFTQDQFPCGRLVPVNYHSYDEQEKVLSFVVPSFSRGERVYGLELHMRTGEIACGCEAFDIYRECRNMPYKRDAAGIYVEQIAKVKKHPLLPLIMREPRYLCPHARKVRQWIRRKGWLDYFKQREGWLLQKLEAVA